MQLREENEAALDQEGESQFFLTKQEKMEKKAENFCKRGKININRTGVNSWDFMFQKLFAEKLTKKTTKSYFFLKLCAFKKLKYNLSLPTVAL